MSDGPPELFEGTDLPTAGGWEALWPDPSMVLTTVGLTAGMDVVDLCSGGGWFTLPIARTARHVLAVDLDSKMLDVARIRLTETGLTNCDFVVGDAYEIDELVPQPVDFIFLANVFHGAPDRLRLARAVRNALNPAGRFAIVNWHQRPREETTVLGEPRGPETELRVSPQETIAAVEPGGLKVAQVVEVPPYHYGVVFERSTP